MDKLNVAIIGSGNIGTDLLMKVLRSPYLRCSLFIGRDYASRGMILAKNLGIKTSDQKINAILDNPKVCDLVFDATSAAAHLDHWPLLQTLGKTVIDLTPSHVGKMTVPAVKLGDSLNEQNVNLISCGGQASIPLAYVIKQVCEEIEYIEVVSSIASSSAGPATRVNLDEYIENTQRGLKFFTQAPTAKAILILNPAEPKIHMQTTIYAKVKGLREQKVLSEVLRMVKTIQGYVPGYQLLVPPIIEGDQITISIKVVGRGDYLPSYSGNLDIINCSALAIAEGFAHKRNQKEVLCQTS